MERLILIVFLWIGSMFGAYIWGDTTGDARVQSLWDKDQIALLKANDALITKHGKEMTELVAKHDKINLENAKTHETVLSKVNNDLLAARAESKRLGGLRITVPVPTCRGTDANAQATGTGQRDEGTSTTIALPEAIENDLWSIVGEADIVTEQLRACQGWIRKSGFYGE